MDFIRKDRIHALVESFGKEYFLSNKGGGVVFEY
jgi:hypothetical protein